MGWQLKITRKDIRGSEAYYRLHNFLISETENGNISRQETVSMIPPLLLDVQPSDKVIIILSLIVAFEYSYLLRLKQFKFILGIRYVCGSWF